MILAMKIQLYDIDEFVSINKLKRITSPVLFQRGDVPHPEGLISNEIFGVTTKERKMTYGYIELYGHMINPIVYKALRRVFRNIDKLVSGELHYIIDGNGHLVEDESGETGIQFLYDNWESIKWTDSSKTTRSRNERTSLITETPKNEVFITKLIVLPAFYRDIRTGVGTGGQTDDINNLYSRVIRLVDIIKNQEMFDFQFDSTIHDIQCTLIDIYDHFKSKLEKKNGLVRKYLMGKNVDFCTRTVITAPTYHALSSDDLFIDFEHVAIPLAQICSLCNPFIVKWIKDFFEREIFDAQKSKEVFNVQTGEVEAVVELDSPETYFSDKFIKKLIDSFIKNPESRFNKLAIPIKDGSTKYLAFRGKKWNNTTNAEDAGIVNRPMTWTDLLYMAAYETVRDKHVEITRYPINDRFGVFFAKIRVSTTQDTVPMIINGVLHKWYPNINLDIELHDIPSQFVDACQFSNAYLEGIEGDYDGDQTTVKIVFTQEANEEIQRAINSKSFFINDSGSNIRTVGKECKQTFFVLTKNPFGTYKELSKEEKEYFLSLTDSDFNFDNLTDWFADTCIVDDTTGKPSKSKSKFNVSDTFVLNKGEYPGITEPTKTTLGRFVFNVIMVRSLGFSKFIPYINEVLTSKAYNKYESKITDALRNDTISVPDMRRYIDRRDWFGLQMHSVITTSFTPAVVKVPKDVKELKDKLMAQHQKEIEDGDVRVIEDIEKELIAKTMESLKDDIGMDLYTSGARGSVGNHLKNIMLTRGAVQNPLTKKYEIIQNSLMDGLAKKDIGTHSNMIVSGAYPKAVGTQVSGYMAKELLAAFQSETLGEKDSDCGSLRTLDIKLTNENSTNYIYRYIMENGEPVLLTEDNIGKYVGKVVSLRSPMFCAGYGETKCLCNKCAGDYYYMLGNKNIGLITSKVATTLTQLNLQKFHKNVVTTQKINIDDILI